jgi:putative endonuclease
MWTVYLLKCTRGDLYCGITNNLEKRLKQHAGILQGGAKYTRANNPCVLVYQEKSLDRSRASKREYEIKKLTKIEKLALINTPCL